MKKKILGLLVTTLLLITVTACASKSSEKSYDMDTSMKEETSAGEIAVSSPNMTSDTSEYLKTNANNSNGNGQDGEVQLTNSSALNSNATKTSNDKIIRRVNMQVETKNFDTLIETIDKQINSLGGYVESSNISGKRYYYSDNMRSANIVARVPKNKLDAFINTINDKANVINKEETTENVTLQYSDIESHKKALKIEQDRLLVLLDRAEKLEDIITLENRLSDIRYELESYESQLRLYDNQVEYSTVTLLIDEVERQSATKEKEKTVLGRIRVGFSDTVYHISEAFKNIIVWLAVNFLYLIIWAIIIAIIIIIIRRCVNGKKYIDKKTQNRLEKDTKSNLLKEEDKSKL